MAASHGLAMFLIWLAFERESAATAGWVLVVRAVASLVVPLAVGHLHDQGRLGPWLKVCAVIEAVGAMVLAWVGWNGGSAAVMITLSVLLGATQSLFDTVLHPMLLAATPSRWRSHVLVGLSYDVAKVIGSSVVLALFVVWESPIPVMAVSLLALAGWRLRVVPHPAGDVGVEPPVIRSDRVGEGAGSGDDHRPGWRTMPVGPVAALGIVALLPGQVAVVQVAAADDSFTGFAVLGTAFAVGAIAGNLALQRLVTSRSAIAAAYVLTATALVWSLIEPVSAFALYGLSIAGYYQLSRVVVVEAAAPEVRGRVSATMTAVSKVSGVVGSVVAAALVDHPIGLASGGAVVALGAAMTVGRSGRRERRTRPDGSDLPPAGASIAE